MLFFFEEKRVVSSENWFQTLASSLLLVNWHCCCAVLICKQTESNRGCLLLLAFDSQCPGDGCFHSYFEGVARAVHKRRKGGPSR